MAGRRPKPVELKLRQGNAGKRITKAEMENRERATLERRAKRPAAKLSPSPKLSKLARQAWPKVAEALEDLLGDLGPRHRMAIELLVEAYSDWVQRRKDLGASGATYKTETVTGATIYRARPEVAQEADAWRRLRLALVEFGLTPASEGRIDRGLGTDDAFDLWLKSRPD